MRNNFADEVTKMAADDPRVVLLSGDIGNRLFDKLKAAAPKQFINCGIAEANMMSMAAGMAMNGLRPIAYTITPFVTTRCLEQIRVDVCYHNVPVTIVGVGAGLSYASLGATHQSCEDMAFLRALPNMTVIAPGDPAEVRSALRMAMAHDGPVYIRMGKKGEKPIHDEPPVFKPGGSIRLREGSDVCLLAVGLMLPVCLEVAETLAKQGISCEVVSCYSVKPLDTGLLQRVFSDFGTVFTVEEHSRVGGFGGAVAEWLADNPGHRAQLVRLGTGDRFLHENTHTEYARSLHGIDAPSIATQVRRYAKEAAA